MGCLSSTLYILLLSSLSFANIQDYEEKILNYDSGEKSLSQDFGERSLNCGNDKTHTLCLPEVGEACKVNNDFLVNMGLSAKEKEEMVDLHNQYRADVANGLVSGLPKASNMQKLM